MGRNLGHVLLALHRGDQVNRDARADWTAADWERWAAIRHVVLAGGLTSGQLGATILDAARGWLESAGYGGAITVDLSPYGSDAPLLGAARYLPPDAGRVLCCDFGHTSVKRALLTVRGDAIVAHEDLPPVPVIGDWHLHPDPDLVAAGRQYAAFVVDALCDAHGRASASGVVLGHDMMLCMAAYVDGGRLLGNGTYATMSRLAPDVRPYLAEAVAQRTGMRYRIRLIHDGTAAAATLAGEPQAAVIALGTALGVGFAPATAEGLRTITAT